MMKYIIDQSYKERMRKYEQKKSNLCRLGIGNVCSGHGIDAADRTECTG